MFLKRIRHELFKPLVFINQINRTVDLLQHRGYPYGLDALFVGVFCIHFIPGLLINQILNTTKPKLSDLIYLFFGVIISRLSNKFPAVNFISRIFSAYSRAYDIVELMNSEYSMYNIVLYNVFHTLTKKFVEKVLFPTEQSILSISDYTKLSTAFFIIYAGRDFNIPSYLILSVSAVIFLSLEFHTSFNLFYIKFNTNNNVSVLNTDNKNIKKKDNIKNLSINNEELSSKFKVEKSLMEVDLSSDNVNTEASVVKRGRGRPAKKEPVSLIEIKQNQSMESEDKESKKKVVKKKGKKKKNKDFL